VAKGVDVARMNRGTKWAARSMALVPVLMLTLVATQIASADNWDSVSEADYNVKCGDLEMQTLTKFDPPNSGTQGGVTLTVTTGGTPDPRVDWESEDPVDAVIVKGGPGANVYSYSGATSDHHLTTPINPKNKNNKRYGLSHVEFCAGGDTQSTSTSTATETASVQATETESADVAGTKFTRDPDPKTKVKGVKLANTGPEVAPVLGSLGTLLLASGFWLHGLRQRFLLRSPE